MEITIFAKKRTNREGKPFTSFITTLTKRNGEKLTCAVKFHADTVPPKAEDCPMNIEITKADCNLAQKQYTDEKTGEVRYSSTLWVRGWARGTDYIDTSMDEYF